MLMIYKNIYRFYKFYKNIYKFYKNIYKFYKNICKYISYNITNFLLILVEINS
jgi:hypothetical protein